MGHSHILHLTRLRPDDRRPAGMAPAATGLRAVMAQVVRAENEVRKALDAYDSVRDTRPQGLSKDDLAEQLQATEHRLDAALAKLADRTDALEKLAGF